MIQNLLVQKATIQKLTVEDDDGIQKRVRTSSASCYRCRVSRGGQSGFVKDKSGDMVRVGEKKIVMYTMCNTPVAKDDQVIVDGATYRVDSVHSHIGGNPNTHHLYCELSILQ